VLAGVDRAVTFSHHIARDLAGPPFAFPAERIAVVPHPPPDLRPALTFLADRRGDAGTRGRAAELLQAEAARRGLRYLRDFPFDEVPYCVLSSQDRQTKNIGLVCDAVHRLVREQRRSVKLITTAPLSGQADWQRLPGFIARQGMQHDILSMHDLDRPEHAALYHCAAVAVHASFIEGGDTVFPFYEAVSLGTPCLMADGPHVQELLQRAPELAPYVFDPHDADALAALIWQTVQHRDAALDVQLVVFERLSRRRWADAVLEYAQAATA
jgi:glycosyltransferase involved in cell wall biosynthesis